MKKLLFAFAVLALLLVTALLEAQDVVHHETDLKNLNKTDLSLIAGIYKKDADSVERALKKGANPNVLIQGYAPALYYALVSQPKPEIIRLLLKYGADPNDWRGCKGQLPDREWRNYCIPLLMPMRDRNEELAIMILEAGADPGKKYTSSPYPLQRALTMDMPRLARMLIEKGAPVNARDENGHSTLQSACGGGITNNEKTAVEIIKLIIDKGADINEKDSRGRGGYPLMRAAYLNLGEIVAYLISRGADVNLVSKEGHTALDYALGSQADKAVCLLRKHGARTKKVFIRRG